MAMTCSAKAGVMLLDQTSAINQVQGDLLFDAPAAKRDHSKLMEAMDKINERYGKATVHIASTGRTQEDEDGWRMKQERRMPRYTTKLDEIPIARA
jgi:DNA polymerase V